MPTTTRAQAKRRRICNEPLFPSPFQEDIKQMMNIHQFIKGIALFVEKTRSISNKLNKILIVIECFTYITENIPELAETDPDNLFKIIPFIEVVRSKIAEYKLTIKNGYLHDIPNDTFDAFLQCLIHTENYINTTLLVLLKKNK